MTVHALDRFASIYANCRHTLGSEAWGRVMAALAEDAMPDRFADALSSLCGPMGLPAYIVDLAKLEWMHHRARSLASDPPPRFDRIMINPTLTVAELGWKNVVTLIGKHAHSLAPSKQPCQVMIWRHPQTGALIQKEAEAIDLLALKLIVEGIDLKAAASVGNATPGNLQQAIDQAVAQGILLSPGSRIRRTVRGQTGIDPGLEPFLTPEVFTLQWHITQHCDLHCKHCYDRSNRASLPKDQAMGVLADLFDFCRHMHVHGQVTFTGGNPLLYPHIEAIYQAAAQYGFGIAILGNPGPIDRIRQLLTIAPPLYFQVSLEGLAEHNDAIRGQGHFHRTIRFLDQLRELDIFTMVMLTLTRDNLDQVLPLAAYLKDRADAFNFNRLSAVGEGAALTMPDPKEYEVFLREYISAAEDNPIIGLKDNLINIIRQETGLPPFGGCTGHGCGAAFNFLALLPDGNVHACRKFPSPVGNILDMRLLDIYQSQQARRYRGGALACQDCRLNPVCRGCLAITHSLGKDVFRDKDPFCFAAP